MKKSTWNKLRVFFALEKEGKVCRLVRSLYGLKQAPKQLHEKFDNVVCLMPSKSTNVTNMCRSRTQTKGTSFCVFTLIM